MLKLRPFKPGKLGATPVTMVHRVDTRSQGVPQAESDEEENRKKLISGMRRAILTDPDKDRLVQECQSSCNNKFTSFSEDAKNDLSAREHRRIVRII